MNSSNKFNKYSVKNEILRNAQIHNVYTANVTNVHFMNYKKDSQCRDQNKNGENRKKSRPNQSSKACGTENQINKNAARIIIIKKHSSANKSTNSQESITKQNKYPLLSLLEAEEKEIISRFYVSGISKQTQTIQQGLHQPYCLHSPNILTFCPHNNANSCLGPKLMPTSNRQTFYPFIPCGGNSSEEKLYDPVCVFPKNLINLRSDLECNLNNSCVSLPKVNKLVATTITTTDNRYTQTKYTKEFSKNFESVSSILLCSSKKNKEVNIKRKQIFPRKKNIAVATAPMLKNAYATTDNLYVNKDSDFISSVFLRSWEKNRQWNLKKEATLLPKENKLVATTTLRDVCTTTDDFNVVPNCFKSISSFFNGMRKNKKCQCNRKTEKNNNNKKRPCMCPDGNCQCDEFCSCEPNIYSTSISPNEVDNKTQTVIIPSDDLADCCTNADCRSLRTPRDCCCQTESCSLQSDNNQVNKTIKKLKDKTIKEKKPKKPKKVKTPKKIGGTEKIREKINYQSKTTQYTGDKVTKFGFKKKKGKTIFTSVSRQQIICEPLNPDFDQNPTSDIVVQDANVRFQEDLNKNNLACLIIQGCNDLNECAPIIRDFLKSKTPDPIQIEKAIQCFSILCSADKNSVAKETSNDSDRYHNLDDDPSICTTGGSKELGYFESLALHSTENYDSNSQQCSCQTQSITEGCLERNKRDHNQIANDLKNEIITHDVDNNDLTTIFKHTINTSDEEKVPYHKNISWNPNIPSEKSLKCLNFSGTEVLLSTLSASDIHDTSSCDKSHLGLLPNIRNENITHQENYERTKFTKNSSHTLFYKLFQCCGVKLNEEFKFPSTKLMSKLKFVFNIIKVNINNTPRMDTSNSLNEQLPENNSFGASNDSNGISMYSSMIDITNFDYVDMDKKYNYVKNIGVLESFI